MEIDIEEVKGSMAKLTKMIQALTAARENDTPALAVQETIPIIVEARKPGAFWPEFVPQGFGPAIGQAPEVGPSILTPIVEKPRPKNVS